MVFVVGIPWPHLCVCVSQLDGHSVVMLLSVHTIVNSSRSQQYSLSFSLSLSFSFSLSLSLSQTEEFEGYFTGRKKLLPRKTDLSFYNWETNVCTSIASANYEV